MAYVSIDGDDRLEEGPEGLQFKSFLGADANAGNTATGVSNTDRGYLSDRPHQGKGGFWTVEYYQPYFDVDTATVLKRCYSTLLPTKRYISEHLNPPDLYGPFWTQTTLIFALFLSSSLGASISNYLSAPGTEYDYDFQLLSIAVTLVYAYGLAVPILLWFALRYMGVGEWSVVEALAVWGYGLFSWIPVSFLCVIPIPILRWILVLLACVQSGYFLMANIYPILASAEAKAVRLVIVGVALLHIGVAISFKVLFFGYYIMDTKVGGDVSIPGTNTTIS